MNAHPFFPTHRPDTPAQPGRDPATLVAIDVCQHCKKAPQVNHFMTSDGIIVTTFHCKNHGDVCPIRSHTVNPPAVNTP